MGKKHYREFEVGADWSRFYESISSGSSEEIASWLLAEVDGKRRLDWLMNDCAIKSFDRTKRKDRVIYNLERKSGVYEAKSPKEGLLEGQKKQSTRYENWFAKRLVRHGIKMRRIGTMLNFEIPFNAKKGENKGRIDIVSYNSNTRLLYFLELKNWMSTEPLIRCLIEAYTYFRSIDVNALDVLRNEFSGGKARGIVVCPMIFSGTTSEKEYRVQRKNPDCAYAKVAQAIEKDMKRRLGGSYRHVEYKILDARSDKLRPLVQAAKSDAETASGKRDPRDTRNMI